MKFGNPSQIGSIVMEVGGTIEAAPTEAQIELFDALIDGCREAVKEGNLDPKVGCKIVSGVTDCYLNFISASCLFWKHFLVV